MDKSVFLTGGNGFVGANLARLLLQEGYTVKALVRPAAHPPLNLQDLAIEVVYGDLHSPQLAQYMAGCRYCFHIAALYSLHRSDRHRLFHTNVEGTRQVLAAARTAGITKTIYTSSVAAIGVRPDGQPATETYQSTPQQLIGNYKKSKYWAEQVANEAIQQGQNIVIVNPSTPIGPWDRKPTPTGEIIVRFLRRQMPFYINTGLNLIHVQDVAIGHLLALEKGRSGERYILGNQNLSFQEILTKLAALTKTKAPRYTVPTWLPLLVATIEEYCLAPLGHKPGVTIEGVRMATQKMYYESHKAITELGLPQTPIDRALAEAIGWFQEHTPENKK